MRPKNFTTRAVTNLKAYNDDYDRISAMGRQKLVAECGNTDNNWSEAAPQIRTLGHLRSAATATNPPFEECNKDQFL